MLELDLILNQFVDRHLETLTEHQLGQMESLLDCSDPELYSWLLDSESPGDKELHDIVQLVRSYR
ncbi:FAD assembly factor SdhE [Legionella spiritensis]|nr:succinate dehydrogenase assembly factor 2 [Legionella spiritensis]